LKLSPSGDDRFFLTESDDFEVHFIKDKQGSVTKLEIDAGPEHATATRVK